MYRSLMGGALLLTLSGCASMQEIKNIDNIADKVSPITYVVPAQTIDGSLNVYQALSRIRFQDYYFVGSGDYPAERASESHLSQNQFSVERYRSMRGSTGHHLNKVSIKYSGTVAISPSGANYKVMLAPQRKEASVQPDIISGKAAYTVDFDEAALGNWMTSARLSWAVEENAKFKPDAIYANFTRLCKRISYGEVQKDPSSGKISAERFYVKVGGKEETVTIDIYPYRDGSKIIARADLPGTVNGGNVSFSRAIAELQKAIATIAKS